MHPAATLPLCVEVDLYLLPARHLLPLAAADDVLDAAERARCNRWLNLLRRREFITGRALLRWALEQHGRPQHSLHFGEDGRPALVGGGDVSLSHSEGHVMVGITAHGRLGVDVETHRVRERTILDRFFSADEQVWMGEDLGRLHQLWTVKEAALKAMGCGVQGNPARLHVAPEMGTLTDVTQASLPLRCWMRAGQDVGHAAVWQGQAGRDTDVTFQVHELDGFELKRWHDIDAASLARKTA